MQHNKNENPKAFQQMALGDFIFSLKEQMVYEQLVRKTSGGWTNIDLIQGKAVSHRVGASLESITLSGCCYKKEGMAKLHELRRMQRSGLPYLLMDYKGKNHGLWKIMDVSETQKRVIDDGTAMIIDFSITLEEFNDGRKIG